VSDAEIGHNAGVAAEELKQLVERVERLHEERKALGDDIADVFKEAVGRGFDKKAMQQVIKLRAMDPDKRRELEAIVELYRNSIGMS
jgi:uncharacterized protein (UPF0335 family)